MDKLTADTVTDDQIRKLRAHPDATVRNEAEHAASEYHRVMGPARWREARQHCADVINNSRTPADA